MSVRRLIVEKCFYFFTMKIVRKQELEISNEEHEKILELFQDSFENYPSKHTFYHQPPHFRYLLWLEDELAGHLSASYRFARSGEEVFSVFGISELCVAEKRRKKGYAKTLLAELKKEAKKAEISQIISLTDNPDFYLNNGFSLFEQEVKWMMMKDFRSLGIMSRRIKDSLVFLSIGGQDISGGPLDMLGPMY